MVHSSENALLLPRREKERKHMYFVLRIDIPLTLFLLGDHHIFFFFFKHWDVSLRLA